MQLDVFVPSKSLAFEYQGEQHFFDIKCMTPQWIYSERDQQKRSACLANGITLVEVPYWWNFQKETLVATIHEVRPDLICERGLGIPIPKEPAKHRGGGSFF